MIDHGVLVLGIVSILAILVLAKQHERFNGSSRQYDEFIAVQYRVIERLLLGRPETTLDRVMALHQYLEMLKRHRDKLKVQQTISGGPFADSRLLEQIRYTEKQIRLIEDQLDDAEENSVQ